MSLLLHDQTKREVRWSQNRLPGLPAALMIRWLSAFNHVFNVGTAKTSQEFEYASYTFRAQKVDVVSTPQLGDFTWRGIQEDWEEFGLWVIEENYAASNGSGKTEHNS